MRIASFSLLILIIINLVIGLNRNKGFNYTAHYSLEDLYPPDCDEKCVAKWTSPDKRYTMAEIETARQFLIEKVGLDGLINTEGIIMQIAGFLHSRFKKQAGNPGELIRSLGPLQQLQLLLKDSSQKLWCGNYQAIFGFLSSAAGLNNRYVEIIAGESVHEVNEIFSPSYKKWIMVDVTRNNIFILQDSLPLSTAEYLHQQLNEKQVGLHIVKNEADKTVNFDTVAVNHGRRDEYFTRKTVLRYYFEMDLKKIYSLPAKIKRYMIADPWFVVYDPHHNSSNLLFRIRQLFLAALGILLLVNVYLLVKKNLLK